MATARSNTFSLTIDNAAVNDLASRVETLSARALVRLSAADAANEVATRFDAVARKAMNAGLNLSDDYIASRMRITRAAPTGSGTVRAEIVARGDLTILGNYPLQQIRDGGATLKNPRGVAGRRPSGVGVEIKRGQPAIEPQWFTMRLRNSGKTGVFVRTTASGGKPVHKYGPSPYSLFRHQIETRFDDLSADLAATVASRAASAVERVLK